MTIRLLASYGPYAPNDTVTLDASTETSLVAQNLASTDLVGGTPFLPRPASPSAAPAWLLARLAAAQRNRAIKAPIGAQVQSVAGQASFTWGFAMQIETAFDAVRPIFLHCDPTPVPGVTVCAAANPNFLGNKSGNGLAYVNGTWAGAASGTLTAGANGRPSVNVPDLIPVSSLERTDGGSGYVVHVRAYIPTNATLPLSLNQTADLRQLAVLDAGMVFSERSAGDFVTTTTGFGGTHPGLQFSPIWGLEFLCRGQVVSTITFGDSITRGQTTTGLMNRNFGEIAALAQSFSNKITFSSANAGWSAQTSAQYLARAQDMIPVLRPTLAVYAAFSPNDHTSTITADAIGAERARVGQFVELCRANDVIPVLWTGLPGAANKGWNAASDALRKAFNAELLAVYGKSALVADLQSAVTNGASPAQLLSNYSSDGLHLQDAGQMASGIKFSQDVLAVVQAGMARIA